MAVVVGDYKSESGMRPLPEAIEEGQHLSDTYHATWVKGTLTDVTDLLNGQLTERGARVTPEVIHMACHGEIDPANPMLNGIVLSDTALRVDALLVLGGELGAGAPFVFLNACQLGLTDSDLLGDQGGLAAAFLTVGARGFLAPLWSVADDLARETAEEFYRLTIDEQVPVGEAMRRLRQRFLTIPGHTQTTPLAYAFYGHPALTLRRAV
jgi:CHAT domain-containing protein